MSGKVILKVTQGKLQGKDFAFDEHDTFIFGRMGDCHACLADDNLVSRHHFILEANPPDARLRDLGSRNGTVRSACLCHAGSHRSYSAGQPVF